MSGEFTLIRRYFSAIGGGSPLIELGVGDDCALIRSPAESESLAVSIDTLVEGVHFPSSIPPEDLGYRALAVNLSDLAAMGARPAWFTLALTLPDSNENWLQEFAMGLGCLARQAGIPLVGGDTTKGPLTITLQVAGLVAQGRSLKRSGASEGDRVVVSGSVGDAAAGLALIQNCAGAKDCSQADRSWLIERFFRPTPRMDLAEWLSGRANAAIDVSDGLMADLSHILLASGLGADIYADRIPMSNSLLRVFGYERSIEYALTGGDDYELCICMSEEILEEARSQGLELTDIGVVTAGSGLRVWSPEGKEVAFDRSGYQHF